MYSYEFDVAGNKLCQRVSSLEVACRERVQRRGAWLFKAFQIGWYDKLMLDPASQIGRSHSHSSEGR